MKRVLHSALAFALALVTLPAAAQIWPTKPIRIIVAFPAGGSTDIATRPVADRMAQTLGQSIIVENRTGAGGNIGADVVAKSPPDGYTILASADALASNPHLYANLSFDVLKDLTAVVQLTRQPVLLAVHPSTGVNSLAELIALAKTKPGMSYATSGAGSQQHIVAEMFAAMAGIQLTHVPYRGGGQAITDLVGGHIPIGSLGSSPLIPHYKAGRLKLLAQSTKTRAPTLPDIPTYHEQGLTDFHIEQWLGLFVPAGTPREVIAKLNAAAVQALAEPAIAERYAGVALEPVGGPPEQLDRLLREDYAKYAKLIRELKIKLE
ncbi:MAG TPA: tripartite tricarboxylate transporter substrate binding protein [Alphaproteobacteria bacterium]|nr:tripartite tricarboxylate transporter substrate binding protein [Alphaproteobacteria bacterium]